VKENIQTEYLKIDLPTQRVKWKFWLLLSFELVIPLKVRSEQVIISSVFDEWSELIINLYWIIEYGEIINDCITIFPEEDMEICSWSFDVELVNVHIQSEIFNVPPTIILGKFGKIAFPIIKIYNKATKYNKLQLYWN
jgi:hypothetical protein